jgi:uncharacterized membrane protein YbhN (UPF0104 family)
MKSILKKVLPWIVAGLIFYQLFSKYSLEQVWAACEQANIAGLMAFMLLYFFVVLWLDCWGHARIFTRFHATMSTRELLPVRMASYVIMLINYGAGQGIWAYFLKKKENIPFFKAMGILFFVILMDLYLIIAMAFLGSLFTPVTVEGVSLNEWVQLLMQIATGGLVTVFLFRKTLLKIIPDHWEKLHDLFLIFREAEIKEIIYALLSRVPLHCTFVVAIHIAALFFNADLPLLILAACIPLIYLVGALPITPGGLGTTQAAFVILLKPFLVIDSAVADTVSPEGLLLAMSILWALFNYLYKALFGLFFLKRFMGANHGQSG